MKYYSPGLRSIFDKAVVRLIAEGDEPRIVPLSKRAYFYENRVHAERERKSDQNSRCGTFRELGSRRKSRNALG